MKNDFIVFTEPGKVEIQQKKLDTTAPQPNEILVEKLYTLISSGTELACLSGNEHWFTMPSTPGYTAVSRIISVGSEVALYKEGDIVFHYGSHSRYEFISIHELIIPVPEHIPLQWVPFIRLATIAMTSLRTSSIELGDYVAVTGLGLVGNMAGQLAGLQGARVIGIDHLDSRLELAKACGIPLTVNGSKETVLTAVQSMTGAEGVSTLIEATGIPQAVESYCSLVASMGELILLGSPRGQHISNITELLNHIHLVDRGCITFKGAHEWKYPLHPQSHVKHSLTRNSHIAMQLLSTNKLIIEPLVSHVLDPMKDAAAAYDGLIHHKETYFGVLFQW